MREPWWRTIFIPRQSLTRRACDELILQQDTSTTKYVSQYAQTLASALVEKKEWEVGRSFRPQPHFEKPQIVVR